MRLVVKTHPIETPPRAWGRRRASKKACPQSGNTPTGVGKTVEVELVPRPFEKHPHGRGEDILVCDLKIELLETPPRAWGRPGALEIFPVSAGNTPTGVGKTLFRQVSASNNAKHPHGRGED